MFVLFIILFLFLLLGTLVAIYSVFFPFIENIGNVAQYNSAYYGALGGIERAESVLRYHQPGFEGSGGFFNGGSFGAPSDRYSGSLGDFSAVANGFSWSIASRAMTIPSSGNGNIDYLLQSPDSNLYNKLSYKNTEKIFLSTDITSNVNDYYTGQITIHDFDGYNFSGILRLPQKAYIAFGNDLLCTNQALVSCDPDQDGLSNDVAVSWTFEGLSGTTNTPFTIYPNLSVFSYSGMNVDATRDTNIRESYINSSGVLNIGSPFANRKYTPLSLDAASLLQHNIVSADSTIASESFRDILFKPNFHNLSLSLGIVSLLRSTQGYLYPFLEYQFIFPQAVSDTFYTLQGIGLVGDYQVKIFIKKSTNKKNLLGDFTIVF